MASGWLLCFFYHLRELFSKVALSHNRPSGVVVPNLAVSKRNLTFGKNWFSYNILLKLRILVRRKKKIM